MNKKKFTVKLTDGAIDNGYIRIVESNDFFPERFWADENGKSDAQFTLILPNGESRKTCVLSNYKRIQARFTSLFAQLNLRSGDSAVLSVSSERPEIYQLSFERGETKKNLSIDVPKVTPNLRSDMKSSNSLNQILFGPPGTGKTYATVDESLKILDPDFFVANQNDRTALKKRFDDFINTEQIRFTTFHQSFSYEDFVEGLRAETLNGAISYSTKSGIFKKLCEDAVELGVNTSHTFSDAIKIFQKKIEDSNDRLTLKTKNGKSFDVEYDGGNTFKVFPEQSVKDGTTYFANIENVRKLYVTGDKTKIYNPSYVVGLLSYLQSECGLPLEVEKLSESNKQQKFVLIIDEINRGNISKIFGELITLIEPSKRAGMPEALSVKLPYTQDDFTVPSNVFIIGTMNTADRSLAGLDIALRRRFTFKEMAPKPELLDEIIVEGINIGQMLRKMNERIEVLLDRDHCLGHAYFMPLKDNRDLRGLKHIFRQQILPLLQEYFFEDWERIAWVLNDQNKPKELCFIAQTQGNLAALFDAKIAEKLQMVDKRWHINDNAFDDIRSYQAIIGVAP